MFECPNLSALVLTVSTDVRILDPGELWLVGPCLGGDFKGSGFWSGELEILKDLGCIGWAFGYSDISSDIRT